MATSLSLPAEGRRLLRGPKLAAAVVGMLALLILALGAVSRSSVLHVREIEVSGASHLSRTDVVRLSGLSDRTNVLWVDTSAAVRRLESDPWIARASVDRQLPFGLRITVTERTPVAVLNEGDRRVLIAGDGTPLGLAPRASGLPAIVVPPRPALSGPAPDVGGPARVLESLPEKIRRQVRRVVLEADGAVRLLLRGGPTVDYGWPEELGKKAATLNSLMAWANGQVAILRSVSLVAADAPAASLAG